MHRATRRATRDQSAKRNSEHLPDGIGGTITGGPMEPVDLMEILSRASRVVSGGGAVSGAAHRVVMREDSRNRGIALSDGSRITFASVEDTGAFKDDDASLLSEA